MRQLIDLFTAALVNLAHSAATMSPQ